MKVKIYIQNKEVHLTADAQAGLASIANVKGETVEDTLARIYKNALFDLTGESIDVRASRPTGKQASLYTYLTFDLETLK